MAINKKIWISVLVVWLLIVILAIATLGTLFHKVKDVHEKTVKLKKEVVGKHLKINEDTLMIVNYKVFSGQLILEDGTKVSHYMLDSLTVKK